MHPKYTDHPTYIDSSEQLLHFCHQWSQAPVLALDTEFIRTDTFYPIGALIQVSDGSGCFLIDPLAIDDFAPFKQLMTDTTIVKVLHSCSEDMEVFDRLLGVLPEPVVDTQIAAALDGLGFSLSYQRLTEVLLDIHVPKGETRSDWLQRPLTDSQIHYAALDVAYLPELYQRLHDSLDAKQRLSWLREECDQLAINYRMNSAEHAYFKRIKSAWKLSPEELGLLQTIIRWREQMARDKDRPRGRILKDRACFDIVKARPRDNRELAEIDDVGTQTVRHYGDDLLRMVKESQHSTEFPERLPPPLPSETRSLAKALKAHVQHRAKHLQVAEEMLARKKDYEALMRSGLDGGDYQLPESLNGWRKAVVGDELLAIARRH